MNKRGSILIFGFMMGLALIILALGIAPAISQFTQTSMNNTWNENFTTSTGEFGNITHQGLDCNNASISDFNKATCIAADINVFYFIGALILLGGALVGARFIGG